MNVSIIYLDGGDSSQLDTSSTNLSERQIFLKEVLSHQIASTSFLVTNNQRESLLRNGILPADSKIQIFNPLGKTLGAIASALLPYDYLEDSTPMALLPTNSLADKDCITDFFKMMLESDHDAGVLLVESDNPNFSYVRTFDSKIIEFVEKRVVGNLATTGVFFFRNKQTLLNCASWSFVNNQTTNGQYFVAPSLNHILTSGGSIGYQILKPSQYQHFSWDLQKG
jgi:hypothetical protein